MMAAILSILVGASVSLLPAQEQTTPQLPSAAVESPVGAAPTSGDNSAASGVPAGAAAPAAGGGCAGCGGHACHPQGCFLRKLLIWATYCPKERICSFTNCCNSCQYKGVIPLYPFFLNPPCVEGCGIHPTFTPQCYRGCKGCAAGAAPNHP